MSISRCTPAANAGWIIGGKVCLALIHLGVSMCAARLLGTAGFGEIQYAATISGLLLPLCTLGLHDVLVPELVRCPKNSGAALGTAIGMRLAASLGVLATWYLLLCLGASGVAVPSVALLYGIGLIFQAAEPLADWFRSRLQSVLPVLISCAAAAAAALCQVGLLLAEQGTPWFALAHGLEAAVAVPLLALAYRRSAGRQLLRPDWNTARDLWNRGRHFLLSGLLVALYGQMDRVMLRAMLGETAVGLYGAASSISTLWIFVPAALVETARPLLLARHHRDPSSFPQKLAALYSILWYGSCAAGLGVCLLARPLLGILYGSSYLPACSTLWVSAWRPAFACLGTARSIFLAARNQFQFEKYLAAVGAGVNLVLNLLLIPTWGPLGAALATLLAQAAANVGAGFLIPTLRENSRLILRGMDPRTLRLALTGRNRRSHRWKKSA